MSGYQGPAGVTGLGQVCMACSLLAPVPGAAGKWPVHIWITTTEDLAQGGQGQALQAVPVLQRSALCPQYSDTGAVRAGGGGRLWEKLWATCWPCSNHRVWQTHRLWAQFSCCLSPGLAQQGSGQVLLEDADRACLSCRDDPPVLPDTIPGDVLSCHREPGAQDAGEEVQGY